MAVFAGLLLLSFLLSVLTKVHPAAYGCLLPIGATVLYALAIAMWPQGSMDALGIPFVLAFGAAGSISGAFVAGLLRSNEGEKF